MVEYRVYMYWVSLDCVQYARDGLVEHLATWKAQNWTTAGNKQIRDHDLWREMYNVTDKIRMRGHRVEVEWVRGHDGEHGNQAAHRLAVRAAKGLQA